MWTSTYVVVSICFGVELALAMGLTDVDVLLPSLKDEVGVVAQVGVLAGDTAVDLEDAVFSKTQGRYKGVWHTIIGTTDRVLATDNVTTGKQADG